MKIFLFTVSMLGIGFVSGTVVEKKLHHCDCSKSTSAALRGCEIVAADVSEELNDCKWKRHNCEYDLSDCVEAHEEFFNLMLNRGNK